MNCAKNKLDVIVVGAGPAGLMSGLAMASRGLRVAVCGKLPTPPAGVRDTRTAALLGPSITMLENLDVWSQMVRECAPIRAIRIVDNLNKVARAPEVMFDADTLGMDRLGWNVSNSLLVDQLVARAHTLDRCALMLDQLVVDISLTDDHAGITLEDGRKYSARLIIGADGARSQTRAAADITVKQWRYPQTALTTMFTHSRDHHDISTEFHRPTGPFTVVPLPGRRSSLVWVDEPARVEQISVLESADLQAIIETRLQGLLGSIRSPARPRSFPLAGLVARRFAQNRVVLVGEAAHAFPPIGAQGLNLTFRDVAVLADCLSAAKAKGQDIGAGTILSDYHERRRSDVLLRSWAVDGLNRSLTSVWPAVGAVRGAVLHAVNSSRTVRKFVMSAGLAGAGEAPSLMRP